MPRHDPVPHDKLAESARRNFRASVWRPKHPRESFRHAVEGLGHAFRTQRNMRFHVAAFLVLFLGALILRIPRLEMIALVVCFSSVLFAEMMNTAIEATVDMITDRYHPAAKYVKDLAAGADLVTATAAAVCCCFCCHGPCLCCFPWGCETTQNVRLRFRNNPRWHYQTRFVLNSHKIAQPEC